MKPDCGIELLFIVPPQHDHGERLLLADSVAKLSK
jgi:hypothetical protein